MGSNPALPVCKFRPREKAADFSGGKRQRIAIARALTLGPKLLICDGVASALVVSIQSQTLKFLLLLRERITTFSPKG